MKAQVTAFHSEPEHVTLGFIADEAKQLADDLETATSFMFHAGERDQALSEEEQATLDRLTALADCLRHQLGRLVAAWTQPQRPSEDVQAPAGVTSLKGIPLEHVEWALKVYRLTASHSRASSNATLERVFERGEAQAREFFGRTQNVWNMRVKGGEAPAFEVILGVQDARKHRKKGSFREVDRALCTG